MLGRSWNVDRLATLSYESGSLEFQVKKKNVRVSQRESKNLFRLSSKFWKKWLLWHFYLIVCVYFLAWRLPARKPRVEPPERRLLKTSNAKKLTSHRIRTCNLWITGPLLYHLSWRERFLACFNIGDVLSCLSIVEQWTDWSSKGCWFESFWRTTFSLCLF